MGTIDPKTAPPSIREWLASAQLQVDEELGQLLSLPDLAPSDPVYRLAEAMRYAVLGGGKRLRPALVLASSQACGGTVQDAMPAAAAIELLHAYTLVHDDLPAMDNDEERRGRPTVHVKFDEATAILVGDALLTLAFGTVARLPSGAAAAVSVLASRGGRDELLGGQMLDLQWQEADHTPDFAELERLHRGKTGALFAAAGELGAIAANAGPDLRASLGLYGLCVGVAFQHADDKDDGDFAEQAGLAAASRHELATKAEQTIECLGASGALLTSFAQWVGRAE